MIITCRENWCMLSPTRRAPSTQIGTGLIETLARELRMTEEELMNGEPSCFFLRHMRSFLISLSALAALLPAMQAQTQRWATPALHHASIEQNGFFYGEEQYYLVTPPLIHVYYLPDAESDVKDDQRARTQRRIATNTAMRFFPWCTENG
jgi:hypothetical protein